MPETPATPVQTITRNNAGGPLLVTVVARSGAGDSLAAWIESYFRFEVTTSPGSQQAQRRDLGRFLAFMQLEEGRDDRVLWTHRLSRTFVDGLRGTLTPQGRRRYSDRTMARTIAHLKTFSKWVHKLRPFPLGDPMAKIRAAIPGTGLETERALTRSEKRRLLDAADCLPVVGGRSKDRHRYRSELVSERPRRKGYRPWRNRAIVSLLIGTGMRRAAVVTLDLHDVDLQKRTAAVREKGGYFHRYQASREAIRAIEDYLEHERGGDADAYPDSPALFLAAAPSGRSAGRLQPWMVNWIWREVCLIAGVEGRTPHSARHAMGRHIIEKTGNVAAVQRQLGHKNAAYSLQYARITDAELQKVVDDV